MSTWSGEIDMKDIAIIDSFPVHDCQKKVLNVGCGKGGIDQHLAEMGYRVYATDIEKHKYPDETLQSFRTLTSHRSDIFDLSSFPTKSSPIVICSQVLEHLSGYKTALVHLLALTEVRLIITVPWQRSFLNPGHINFWDDPIPRATAGALPHQEFKDIHEFIDLCRPYKTTVSKILTKPQDVGKQYGYLIVVDKRQKLQ